MVGCRSRPPADVAADLVRSVTLGGQHGHLRRHVGRAIRLQVRDATRLAQYVLTASQHDHLRRQVGDRLPESPPRLSTYLTHYVAIRHHGDQLRPHVGRATPTARLTWRMWSPSPTMATTCDHTSGEAPRRRAHDAIRRLPLDSGAGEILVKHGVVATVVSARRA